MVLTDLPELLTLLRDNIALNQPLEPNFDPLQPRASSSATPAATLQPLQARVAELSWSAVAAAAKESKTSSTGLGLGLRASGGSGSSSGSSSGAAADIVAASWDVVVGSDVLYIDQPVFDSLLATLLAVTKCAVLTFCDAR